MTSLGQMFGAREVETFMGVPRCRDLSRLKARVAIMGADCATPYMTAGAYCQGGPAAIRAGAADFAANRTHVNFDLGGVGWDEDAVVDAGDLEQDPDDPAGNRARIFGGVSQILDRGAIPILLGGDDSVTIPVLEAYGARGTYTILQVDAHIDWRDEVQDERLGLSSVMRRASEMEHIGRIVQVGQRGVGSARPEDLREAKEWGVEFVPGGEVARSGVARAIDSVPAHSDVIVCFDFDALDPAIMPAVIARTAGGLRYWQALELIAGVAAKARIRGLIMTEFMAGRDIDGMGATTAAELLISTLGLICRQNARS